MQRVTRPHLSCPWRSFGPLAIPPAAPGCMAPESSQVARLQNRQKKESCFLQPVLLLGLMARLEKQELEYVPALPGFEGGQFRGNTEN